MVSKLVYVHSKYLLKGFKTNRRMRKYKIMGNHQRSFPFFIHRDCRASGRQSEGRLPVLIDN